MNKLTKIALTKLKAAKIAVIKARVAKIHKVTVGTTRTGITSMKIWCKAVDGGTYSDPMIEFELNTNNKAFVSIGSCRRLYLGNNDAHRTFVKRVINIINNAE